MAHHNVITQHAALAIFHKVENSSIPIAIFSDNGSWNATKINTQNFARMFAIEDERIKAGEKPRLLAIYTIETRLGWIEDDLAEAGIR